MSGEAGEELDTPAARVRARRESRLRRARTRQKGRGKKARENAANVTFAPSDWATVAPRSPGSKHMENARREDAESRTLVEKKRIVRAQNIRRHRSYY